MVYFKKMVCLVCLKTNQLFYQKQRSGPTIKKKNHKRKHVILRIILMRRGDVHEQSSPSKPQTDS